MKKEPLQRKRSKHSKEYNFYYSSGSKVSGFIMTRGLWIALLIGIIALVVFVNGLIWLHNHHRSTSPVKTYHNGRR